MNSTLEVRKVFKLQNIAKEPARIVELSRIRWKVKTQNRQKESRFFEKKKQIELYRMKLGKIEIERKKYS